MVANSDDETHTSNEPRENAATPTPQRLAAPLQTRDPDRYDILGEHGRGGLGKVARAHDKELGRHVAIKELITRSDLGEVRFLREAMITARLEHPSIVPIHEAGRWPDGRPFYVMKLVAGRSLKELLAERKTVDQRIELLPHVVAVADAVAYAHERKIIHRDLKPANVIVGDFGETVVIDWGLAKDLSQPDEPAPSAGPEPIAALTDLTEAGTVLGTPTYMAPEQFRGEAVDQRADVFAIGAMLWELCSTSKVPPADSRHRDRLLRKAGIDKDLGAILAKALSSEPEQRYRGAGELSADLRAFIAGARIASRRYSLLGLAMHWIRRHRALTFAIGVATALALTGSFIYVRNIAIARGRADAAAMRADLERVISSVEQGRQALLLGNTAQAAEYLGEAYRLGDRSWSTEFMYARALEPQQAELARFQSLKGRMWSAAYSPDERQIVTTDEGGVQIWDARTYRRIHALPHADVVYNAVYTSDGARVLTACGDAVRIWDANSGTLVRELRAGGPSKRWSNVDVSGDFVAAISLDARSMYAWNATTGAAVASSHGEKEGSFATVAFSPDGRWLATIVDEEGRLFDTATWKQGASIPGLVRALAWDPTGERLGTGSSSGELSIWEISSRARIRIRETGAPIDVVALSPDGKLIGTAERDGTARVWDAKTGAQRGVSAYPGRLRSMVFDATSTQLAVAASDGSVRVVEALSGLPLAALDGAQDAIWSMHFDSSASRVLAASWDGFARVWSTQSSYRQWASSPMASECGVVNTVVPDQRYVIVGCEDHATRVWDTAQDRLLAELRPMRTKLDGDFAPVLPVVSETGSRAAIAHGNTVEVYELPGGRLLRTIDHGAQVTAVAFGRSGEVVSGAENGDLWRTPEGQRSIALPPASAGIDAVALLADGRVVSVDAAKKLRVISSRGVDAMDTPTRSTLLRPSQDGSKLVTVPGNQIPSLTGRGDAAVLWDLRSPHLVSVLDGHKGRVFTARWHEERVLTTASDGTVRLWDGSTGRAVTVFKAHVRRFLADAAISSDGAILAAGGADGTVDFWDVATGRELWTLRAHTSFVVGLHFDGPDFVTRGFGGEVVRWRFAAASEVVRRKALR